ncbi:cytochrome P450 [Nocardia sp. NPDC051570]|uniref:cytochrome P450 n=1 Tax=Nocardia sp. NPDC051570 TaxID=3364324 RepID=UPI0037911A58
MSDEIIDLSGLGAGYVRDPYPFYARLRERGPVHRVLMPGGLEAWLVVGFEQARAVLADTRLSKDLGPAAESLGIGSGPNMLIADPPNHTRLRKLVSQEFTPRRVTAMAPAVQRQTDLLLDDMLAAPEGAGDLVNGLSFPLPMTILCDLLGVPFLEREAFRNWSNVMVGTGTAEEKAAVAPELSRYLLDLLDRKRTEPGDDLMSALIRTTDEDGDRLSRDELLGMAWILLVVGHETTVNLISNTVLALLENPEQLEALRDDFGLLDGTIEESLRYDGPVEYSTFRLTVDPIEIGGTLIPGGGQLVLASLADANRDAARFPDPHRFDIRRGAEGGARGHLAFGHGMHYCIGAPLARLEASVAIRSLLQRCPELRLDIPSSDIAWRPGVMRGPEALPVRWKG